MASLGSSLSAPLGNALSTASSESVDPPVADAGSDTAKDMMDASPALTLDGSATGDGTITYLWSKVSGPGTPTFTDATDPETAVTFDVDGEYVLRLTATNEGGDDTDDVVITVAATLAALLTNYGSQLSFMYWVGQSAETLNGSTQYTQLNDLGPGAKHATAGAGNEPAKGVGTGPNGLNCIAPQAATKRISHKTIGQAAGEAGLWFCVTKATSSTAIQCGARTGADDGLGSNVCNSFNIGTAFASSTKCNGVAEETATIVTPAHNTNWNTRSTRFAAATPPITKIGNVAVSPAFLVSTGLADNIGTVVLGHATAGGGLFYMCCFVKACTGTQEAQLRYLVTKISTVV